jgi:tetratricopeptide (TPR) repeat protein
MRHPTRSARPAFLLAVLAASTSTACAGSTRLVSTPTPQLEARVAKDSLDATAHYQLALARWSDNRYDDAEAELKEAVALDPKYAEAYLALGYLVFARRPALWDEIPDDKVPAEWKDRVRQATTYRRRALILDPLVKTAIVRAVEPKFVETHTDPLVYQTIWGGFDDYNTGRYEAAYTKLSNLMKLVSSRMAGQNRIEWDSLPDILFWYQGLAAAQTKRYGVALQNIQRVLKRKKAMEKDQDLLIVAPLQTGELRYLMGVIQQRGGFNDAAEESFKAALTEDLGLYMAHVRLADLYQAQGHLDEAVQERQRATDANPDDPSLLVDLGRTLLLAGNASGAVKPLRRAITLQPHMLEAYHQLGRALVALHDPEARATLNHFIECAPSTMAAAVADARQLLDRVARGS